jgi:hypothetical protein
MNKFYTTIRIEMDLKTKVKTDYGDVSLETLIKVYHQRQVQAVRKAEWLKTEEGKAYNRKKAAEYYAANRDEVLMKRILNYDERREELNARANEYYHKNKEVIRAKANAKKEAERAAAAAVPAAT